ncbi:unnamed protein product [Spirodela intermedia]|uniref:Myb/SANT-like DNA-binding domain-containing protein n=1 Tax=Spirodela intermedia TaxID=51605 RepID=A0A7I8JEE4_SPIIN|nr:unnamed protein product [Spirodela intermedia]CAA6668534.1 unnamed protein product [Spirodela intermedia]
MEGNGLAEGMIPGILGLEMPLHQAHHQIPAPPPTQQHHHHRQVLLFPSQLHQNQAHLADADHNAAAASKHTYSFGGGAKVKPAPSPDEEPSAAFGEDVGMDLAVRQQSQPGVSASSTPSPWQRMKWTDAMVRLLIMVVYCVGDEGGPDGGGGGKWKSVSRAMMEKGHYVSPQQCEDKFNDLNKRYKRVNDILGRGTACRVVENQALLDTMDHLSPKAKEEVRKLLNSKHLFFREMCAYHRSCAAASSAGEAVSSASTLEPHHQSCEAFGGSDPYSLHQQQCSHLTDISGAPEFMAVGEEVGTALKIMTTSSDKMAGERGEDDGMGADEDDDEEDEDEDDDYDEDDEDEEHNGGVTEGGGLRQHRKGAHGDDEDGSTGAGVKRQRRSSSSSPFFHLSSSQQQLKGELASLTGSPEQQRQWLSWRAVELEERRVNCGRRALELEKQRFKWLRFSGNKEREMERVKLENERLSLENERMLLLLRQKEFELACQGNGGAVDHIHKNATSHDGPSASAA